MDFDEFTQIWQQSAPHACKLTYRLYYNAEDGSPLFYSMDDLPGTYIELDQATFQRSSSHVRVIDGKLIERSLSRKNKITPGPDGVACHPRDVAIVVSQHADNVKWKRRA